MMETTVKGTEVNYEDFHSLCMVTEGITQWGFILIFTLFILLTLLSPHIFIRQFPSISVYMNTRQNVQEFFFLNVNIVRIVRLSLTLDQNIISKYWTNSKRPERVKILNQRSYKGLEKRCRNYDLGNVYWILAHWMSNEQERFEEIKSFSKQTQIY